MTKITLRPLIHKDEAIVAISFPFDLSIKTYIKGFQQTKYSKTHRTYYFVNNAKNRSDFYKYIRLKNWFIDYSALSEKKKSYISREETIVKPDKKAMYAQLDADYKRVLTNYISYLRRTAP